ncbi:putative membrane-associated, metal-dependent hydrolase [Anaerovibrio sp. JC8]|uniref:phosphoethanolamine transferase n=1 Tax=Anaerovibrio sp. JC8 TaxID=1240085 RepID=UPI000A0A9A95|nr:phosphoethanolamine transferase [Anaerovibrio sp. JC8]ORT99993.1 putative membrane-associated, metal-dependent hydrolase [Anaerovibrio sp. JC8]
MDRINMGKYLKQWGACLLVAGWWYAYVLYQYLFIKADTSAVFYSGLMAGTMGAAAFILLQFLCERYIKKPGAFWCLDIMQFIYCLPPLFSIIHYQLYGSLITYDEATAIHNTNFREALEWLLTYVGPLYTIMLGAVMVGSIVLIHKLRSLLMENSQYNGQPPLLILTVTGMLAVSLMAGYSWLQTDFMAPYAQAVRYSMGLSQYYRNMEGQKDNIVISNPAAVTQSPHTIIMVIGESATRDRMKAYTPSDPFDDTPWLSRQIDNPDFIIFNNAYACQSLTQQVLESALTEKSAYNGKDFLNSMNIIDVAKKKGYKTYWITNLGRDNNESSFFNVAARADVLINTGKHDDHSMIGELASINPQESNLIILHGNGSHAAYKERYPKDKALFTDSTREAEYANSIRYTDEFLQAVFEYGRKNLNLQVMLYFSDHGEHMGTGHTPNDRDFVKVRIPMFIYLAPEYQSNNPAKYGLLKDRKDTFFTNDMMYNTLSGIMNAESGFYEAQEDLSSPAYNFTPETLWTFGKAIRVSEDPNLK